MLLFYGLRGFGYPLFVFGFLVWIVLTVSPSRLGSACGWFWFAFTGGLPTLGSVFARISIPIVGACVTLCMALGNRLSRARIARFGIRDRRGAIVEHKPGYSPLTTFASLAIVRYHPEVGLGRIVRAINTASEFGLLVISARSCCTSCQHSSVGAGMSVRIGPAIVAACPRSACSA